MLNRLCDGDRIALLQFGCSHNDDSPLSETCAASAAISFHTSPSLLLRFVCAASIAHTLAESSSASEDNSLRVQLSSPAHVPDDAAVARVLRMFNKFSLSFFSLPSLNLPRLQIHRNIGTGTERHGVFINAVTARVPHACRAQNFAKGSAGCTALDASAGKALLDLPRSKHQTHHEWRASAHPVAISASKPLPIISASSCCIVL